MTPKCKSCGAERLPKTRSCFMCRLWSYIEQGDTDTCWPWNGARNAHGYGFLSTYGQHRGNVLAHREVARFDGQEVEGRVVMHACDNPACCNPSHLLEATQAENLADMKTKGRQRNVGQPGESNPNAIADEQMVREIRGKYAVGGISQQAIADYFGVTRAMVCDIVRRKSWRHVA